MSAISSRRRRAVLSVLLALAAIILLGAVSGFAAGGNTLTIHVLSGKPRVKTLDFGQPANQAGDLYVVSAKVLSANGRTLIGELRGTQTAIRLEDGSETVQALLTFELGRGNEIVVGGLGQYPRSGIGLLPGKTFVRPVLGGSGRYDGVRGELFSKQLPNGRYDQVFRLRY